MIRTETAGAAHAGHDGASPMTRAQEREISRRRVEDDRFLRGRGRFVEDIAAPDALHGDRAALAACPCAHRRDRRGCRARHARRARRADRGGSARRRPRPAALRRQGRDLEPLIIPPRPALAEGRVRHVGDPVAFVVAETPAQARDAAEAIRSTTRRCPPSTDGAAALRPARRCSGPRRRATSPSASRRATRPRWTQAFARAAHRRLDSTCVNNRVIAAPHGTARRRSRAYDAATQILPAAKLTGQGVHAIRRPARRRVFEHPAGRASASSHPMSAAASARRTSSTRNTCWLMGGAHARPAGALGVGADGGFPLDRAWAATTARQARLALDAEGRFLGARRGDGRQLGAYLSGSGPGSSTKSPGTAHGRLYAIPAVLHGRARRLHQHGADRCLSRRRQARGELHHRAPGGPRGARAPASMPPSCAGAT